MNSLSKIFLLISLFLFAENLCAQGFYQRMETKQKKYFAGLSYGKGTARWNSKIKHSQLYDNNGGVLREGEVKFKVKNSTQMINLEVLMPVKRVRLGLGICFEEFFLDKLTLEENQAITSEANYVIFDETFTVNKLFAQIEVPFSYETESSFSVNFNGHVGYFGLSGVGRLNFFGEEPMAKTYFVTAGILADLKVYPHIYIFVYPHAEYKYFDNSRLETPSDITHNIFTGTVLAGIRVDMSKE